MSYRIIKHKNHSLGSKRLQNYQQGKQGLDETRTVAKGWAAQLNETLWHKTKGDADYKTHEGNGKTVDTIRNQGSHLLCPNSGSAHLEVRT